MNIKIGIIIAALVGIIVGVGAPRAKAVTGNEPNLCDLGYDGQPGTTGAGWLCMQCGMSAPCDPQSGSGWLCCGASGVCVQVVTANECDTGLCGWCEDISVTKLRNGVEVAICENGD